MSPLRLLLVFIMGGFLFPGCLDAPDQLLVGYNLQSNASDSSDNPLPGDASTFDTSADMDGMDDACAFPCDLVAQCGCASGESCTLGSEGPECTTPGLVEQGQVCQSTSDCALGLGCGKVIGDSRGVCMPYCYDASNCGGAYCVGAPTAPAGVCDIHCDMVDQTGCPQDLACSFSEIWGDSSSDSGTICHEPGLVEPGETCNPSTIDQRCTTGHVCVDDRCRRWCDPSAPSCPTGSCKVLPTSAITVHGKQVAVCQ